MCYAKLGDIEQAQYWSTQAMPQPGPKREIWVERMVQTMDSKLAELDEIGGTNDRE